MATNDNVVVIGESEIKLLESGPVIVGSDLVPATTENQLEVNSYFPTNIYSIKKPEFLNEVRTVSIEALDKQKKQQPKVDPIYPLYQTDNLYNDPRLAKFANYIGATAWNILDSQGHNMQGKSVAFTEMWCQEHQRHSAMDEHVHGLNSQLIGFYFLDVPMDSQRMLIQDPRPAKKQINLPERNASDITYASSSINFVPEPGLLMFANSWLPHSFSRNASSKAVRFIHFNIIVIDSPQQTQSVADSPIIV